MPETLLRRRSILMALAVGSTLPWLQACGSGDDDLVQIVRGNPDLGVLAEALDAAQLAETLQGVGPFTVFAPTNAAFTAMLAELGVTKAELFAPAQRDLLVSVLLYHVVPSRVESGLVPGLIGRAVTSAQGGIFIFDDAVGLRIQDARNRLANVTATDFLARNGVLHIIDRVLLPANQTIVQTAQALPDFSILVEAVVAANLVQTLSGAGPFTVFAPTNAAFAAALAELGLSKEALLASPLLGQILTYHVLAARVLAADVPVNTPITTVQGAAFTITPQLAITDALGRSATITGTNVLTSNGVIHVIDRVILPRALA